MARPRFTLAVLFVSLAASMCFAQQADFTGQRVARVTVNTPQDVELLMSMTDDVWSHHLGRNHKLDVRLSPAQYQRLLTSGLDFTILVQDLQDDVDAARNAGGGDGPYDDYMSLDQIVAYMENDVMDLDVNNIAQIITLGQTIEGRDIKGFQITGPDAGPKPGVYYEGLQHAREWIAPPTVLYFAEFLIRGYNAGDPEIVDLVNRAEFYIVPVTNPDGYVFSRTSNRMWRKNRRDNGDGTFGVDLNRNWSVGWGGQGSSGDTSSNVYRGTAPFSEPETRAVSDFVNAHPNIVTFNDLHSYSQYILLPYGDRPDLPANQDEYMQVARAKRQLIQDVHGVTYLEGNTYSFLYPAAGVALDWGHEAAGALSYSFELRDTGQFGFLLPPDQIRPTAEEIFPALLFQASWTTTALVIQLPNGLPQIIDPAGGTTLRIDVTGRSEAVDPDGVSLYVRAAGEPAYTSYAAQYLGGDEFEATFGPVNCDGDVEFYVVALGMEGGEVRSPSGAPDSVFSAPPGARIEYFADNFETDLGWTPENLGATSGDWQRGVPVNDPDWAFDPASDSDGSGRCWLTQNEMGNTDVDDGAVRLTSPLIDMSSGDVTISYDYMLRLTRPQDNTDHLLVEINSDDGAGEWIEIARHSADGGLGWYNNSITADDLAAAGVTLTATMRMRFTANDADQQSIVEAGLDAFHVFSVTCQSGFTPGDINCDGDINAFDIEPFLVALFDPDNYQNLYPDCDINTADINQDGAVDAFDIEPFLDLLF